MFAKTIKILFLIKYGGLFCFYLHLTHFFFFVFHPLGTMNVCKFHADQCFTKSVARLTDSLTQTQSLVLLKINPIRLLIIKVIKNPIKHDYFYNYSISSLKKNKSQWSTTRYQGRLRDLKDAFISMLSCDIRWQSSRTSAFTSEAHKGETRTELRSSAGRLGIMEWDGKHHQAIMWCWRGWWCWCKQWWIPLLIDLAIKWPQSQRRTATLWMRSPIMSQRRTQPLCQEGNFTNKPHVTERVFLFHLRCNPATLFCWVGVLEELWRSGQKLWSEESSSGRWPLIGPAAARAAVSHRDGDGEEAADKRRVVQRWRGTMGRFERRRWGELNPQHKHLIVKACFVKIDNL